MKKLFSLLLLLLLLLSAPARVHAATVLTYDFAGTLSTNFEAERRNGVANDSGYTASQGSGVFSITVPSSGNKIGTYAGLRTNVTYNLTGGHVQAEVPAVYNAYLSKFRLFLWSSRENFIEAVIQGGGGSATLYMAYRQSGEATLQYTTTAVTYNATNHRWIRLRHDNTLNRVYLEVSANGSSWADYNAGQYADLASRAVSLRGMYAGAEQEGGENGTGESTYTTQVDNFLVDGTLATANTLSGYKNLVANGTFYATATLPSSYTLSSPSTYTSALRSPYVDISIVNPKYDHTLTQVYWEIGKFGKLELLGSNSRTLRFTSAMDGVAAVVLDADTTSLNTTNLRVRVTRNRNIFYLGNNSEWWLEVWGDGAGDYYPQTPYMRTESATLAESLAFDGTRGMGGQTVTVLAGAAGTTPVQQGSVRFFQMVEATGGWRNYQYFPPTFARTSGLQYYFRFNFEDTLNLTMTSCTGAAAPACMGNYSFNFSAGAGAGTASYTADTLPAPTAHAGDDLASASLGYFWLTGRKSYSVGYTADPGQGSILQTNNSIQSYAWKILTAPTGSTATLATPNEAATRVLNPSLGTYTLQLTVTDSEGRISTDTVSATVEALSIVTTGSYTTKYPYETFVMNPTIKGIDGGGSATWSFDDGGPPCGRKDCARGALVARNTTATLVARNNNSQSATGTAAIITEDFPAWDGVDDITYTVTAGSTSDLQSKINSAMAANYNWVRVQIPPGNYTAAQINVPARTGTGAGQSAGVTTGYVVFESTGLTNTIYDRIDLADTAQLVKAQTGGGAGTANTPAMIVRKNADRVVFKGWHFVTDGAQTQNTGLVDVGEAASDAPATAAADIPQKIHFDRCLFVGTAATYNVNRGLVHNADNSALVNSSIHDIKDNDTGAGDTQGWWVYNAYGPFFVFNNYIEATGENIFTGGDDPFINELIPADFDIRQNHVARPSAWRGTGQTVKHLLEFKIARRASIVGNVFEYNWDEGQAMALNFAPLSQNLNASWTTVQDVNFEYNISRHHNALWNVSGELYTGPIQHGKNVYIRHNVSYDFPGTPTSWGSTGYAYQVAGMDDFRAEHNTAYQEGAAGQQYLKASGEPNTASRVVNNIFAQGSHALSGSADLASNWARSMPGTLVANNVLPGNFADYYPEGNTFKGNLFPSSVGDSNFVNKAAGDYELAAASAYRNASFAGTGFSHLGADTSAVSSATATVTGGTWSLSGGGGGSDTTPPTVSVTAPASMAVVSGTITLTATAADNVGVVGVQFKRDGGIAVGAEDTIAPYSTSLDTTALSNGSHTLTATARDEAGNMTTSTPVTVTVTNDLTAPTVSITSPTHLQTIAGNHTVTATASDDIGVLGVKFYYDGTLIGTEDTTAPFSVIWDTLAVMNMNYSLTAVARDAAGRSTTSAAVTATVFNDNWPPMDPVISTAARVSKTSLTITWMDKSTDETGFKLERSTDQTNWTEIVLGANVTSYTDTGLTPRTRYFYRVRAYNSQGNSSYSTVVMGVTTLIRRYREAW